MWKVLPFSSPAYVSSTIIHGTPFYLFGSAKTKPRVTFTVNGLLNIKHGKVITNNNNLDRVGLLKKNKPTTTENVQSNINSYLYPKKAITIC